MYIYIHSYIHGANLNEYVCMHDKPANKTGLKTPTIIIRVFSMEMFD